MKQGKNIKELADALMAQVSNKQDYIVPTREMAFDDAEHIIINGVGVLGAQDLFQQQVATYLGYPYSFWQETREKFAGQWRDLANTMLAAQNTPRMVRTIAGNSRAFLSNKYRTIDNWDIAEIALKTVGNMDSWQVDSAELTETKMYIKVFSPRIEREVKKGDVVRAGFLITNSEVGLGSANVSPMILRLNCLNGQVIEDMSVAKRHLSKVQVGHSDTYELFSDETKAQSDKALLMQMADVIRTTVDEARFALVVKKFTDTTERHIDGDVPKVVEVLAKTVNLNDTERSSVLRHLISGGDLTQFGLINAVTAAAQEVNSYDRSVELERIGGNMMDLTPAVWKSIASAN